MSNFKPGEEVVLVDDKWPPHILRTLTTNFGTKFPVKNKVYTVRDRFQFPEGASIILCEIVNPLVDGEEPNFKEERFRRLSDILPSSVSEEIEEMVR